MASSSVRNDRILLASLSTLHARLLMRRQSETAPLVGLWGRDCDRRLPHRARLAIVQYPFILRCKFVAFALAKQRWEMCPARCKQTAVPRSSHEKEQPFIHQRAGCWLLKIPREPLERGYKQCSYPLDYPPHPPA